MYRNVMLPPPGTEWEASPLLERPEHICVETLGLGPEHRGSLVSITACSWGAEQEEGAAKC